MFTFPWTACGSVNYGCAIRCSIMMSVSMRGMRRLARGGVALGMLLVCPCALALNPALDISQYAHHAWRNSEGFAKGPINSIAQTADGYLWLGTDFGLLRFDGV